MARWPIPLVASSLRCKWQRSGVPALAPEFDLFEMLNGLAVRQAVSKAPRAQMVQPFSLRTLTFGPVPDKQANALSLFGAQVLACHKARHSAAGIDAACNRLNMVGQAPVQFALQHDVHRLRQLFWDGVDVARRVLPVLTPYAIAPADDRGRGTEREIFNQAKYVVQSGPVKDLSVRLRGSWLRVSSNASDYNVGGNEVRVFVDYPISIF